MSVQPTSSAHAAGLPVDDRTYGLPGLRGCAGVARRDVTPPVGIYARNWGAARHEAAEGIQAPLTCSALALTGERGGPPLVLLALDHGWWRAVEDEPHFREAVARSLGVPAERVVLALSHTHSGPSLSLLDRDHEGGELIPAYREHVLSALVDAGTAAVAEAQPCVLEWGTDWCDAARDRDLPVGDRVYCGFHPGAAADGTLLVGRVARRTGELLATVVNYACHPTIMAWENRLISPDWVGALRTRVEAATGVPCLFLQGASGELAAREQHTSSLTAVEQTGAHVASATLATLDGMLPPGVGLRLARAVESGAPAAVWEREPMLPGERLAAVSATVGLPRGDLVPLEELERRWADLEPRVAEERLSRARELLRACGDGPEIDFPYTVWALGDAWLVALPAEGYSWLQGELRRRFGTVVVSGLSNGFSYGYLPPAALYERPEVYQVWQSPFGAGALERLLEAIAATIETLGEG